ncbi:MAG: hypothetical protein ABW046_13685 [Actinoplanes sp.]
MDKMMDHAYAVNSELFGAASGIPWWGWMFVVLAIFWKVAVPERKSVRASAEERDEMMLGQLFGDDSSSGKKGKKSKK